jgi:uncharacterized protein YktB (UPF0637 family)
MVVNFRVHEISRGAQKLVQTPTLIIIKNNNSKFGYCLTCQLLMGMLHAHFFLYFRIISPYKN